MAPGVPLAAQSLQVHEVVIPLEDEVGRQQAPVLQRLDAEQTLLPESHGAISFGLRWEGKDTASGAQTGRRGGAGPAGACWAVRAPPATIDRQSGTAGA